MGIILSQSGKAGLLMFYETNEKSDGEKTWVFSKYDTDLKEVETKEAKFDKSLVLNRHYLDDSLKVLYFLFTKPKVRGAYQIASYDIKSGEVSTVPGTFKSDYTVKSFAVLNNKAHIDLQNNASSLDACLQMCLMFTCIPTFTGLTVFKFHSFVNYLDLKTGEETIEQLKHKGNTFILDNQVTDDNEHIKILVRNKPNRKSISHYLYDYSIDGKLVKQQKIKTDAGKEITSGKYQDVGKNRAVLIGTYTQPKIKKFTFNPASSEAMGYDNISHGMYFSLYEDDEQSYIKFYPFSKFENFYRFLTEKSKQLIDKKVEKAERKGKEPKISYNLLVHDIIQKNNEFIVIAEAYYPEYERRCYTTYSNGTSSTTCSYVFVGYRYTHAVIGAFDQNGELIWDNSFPIAEILTYNLKRRVKVLMDGDDIVMAYSYGGYIKSQIIRGNEVVQGKQSTKIETGNEGDNVKSAWASEMEFWYDNFFLTWGYEKIKDKDKNKRTVFYFNKIGFE
jgi:hypothetical protein